MPTLDVKQKWTGENGWDQSVDGTAQIEGDRITYTVTTDDPNTTRAQILAADGLPVQAAAHPTNSLLRVRKRYGRRVSPIMWEVDIDYEQLGSQGGSSTGVPPGGTPLDKPARFSWRSETTEEAVDEDVNGAPICLPITGEQYDPPPTRRVTDRIMTVERNQATYDDLEYSTYCDCVNSEQFGPYPAGTVLIEAIDGGQILDDVLPYFAVVFVFHIRRGAPRTTDAHAWWKRRRVEGYKVKHPTSGKIVWAKTNAADTLANTGEESPVPVTFDPATGYQLEDPLDAAWVESQDYVSKSFAPLNIF